jgi:uncharacterized protein (TIGR03435 family)
VIRLPVIWSIALAAVSAQPVTQKSSFEVATVKPSGEGAGSSGMRPNRCSGGPGSRDPLRYTCRGLTLKTLIEIAYEALPSSVSGPAWIESEHYDIVAKPPDGATRQQMGGLLRNLLEERFALKIRRDSKVLPVYALLAPHGGARLQPSVNEPEDPAIAAARGREAARRRLAWGRSVSMVHIDDPHMSLADLAGVLSTRLDRPVRDMTGLNGAFAIGLDFVADSMPAGDDAPRPPTVFEAVQDQLGLRLEASRAGVEVLVVLDALKKPRQND